MRTIAGAILVGAAAICLTMLFLAGPPMNQLGLVVAVLVGIPGILLFIHGLWTEGRRGGEGS